MERRIQDYLAGRLSASEAEEFEARMFADDELAAEVERALEIRAAMQTPAAVANHARRRSARLRPAWALAAGIGALALGFTWMRWQTPSAPVFRGGELRMGLQVEVAGDTLNARWTASPGAAGYELQFFALDGRLVHSVEVTTPSASVDLRAAEMAGAAGTEVAALDEFGQTTTRSQRVFLIDVAR